MEIEYNWPTTRTLSWLSSYVIKLLLYFINELKMTDLHFLICFLAWHFRIRYLVKFTNSKQYMCARSAISFHRECHTSSVVFFTIPMNTYLLRFKSLNKHGTTNIKNQNPNKLSQSNNSIIFNNLNVTCSGTTSWLIKYRSFYSLLGDCWHALVCDWTFVPFSRFYKNDDIKNLDPKKSHLVNLQQLTTENRIESERLF